MQTLIKNCGFSTPQTIACAVATGASYIGFVHHDPSPRHVSASQIESLSGHVPPDISRVIVLVNPNDATLAALPQPNFWQITGVSNPARIAEIHRQTGIPVITAIPVSASPKDSAFFTQADQLEVASAHLLFDTQHPTEAGGSGVSFDWSLLAGMKRSKPWFLAGGLTSGNIGTALGITHAPIVDVSSGIEDAPGVKSIEKIAAFNAAVLASS